MPLCHGRKAGRGGLRESKAFRICLWKFLEMGRHHWRFETGITMAS